MEAFPGSFFPTALRYGLSDQAGTGTFQRGIAKANITEEPDIPSFSCEN